MTDTMLRLRPAVRLIDLALDVGAVYRLTRLVTRDALLDGPRAALSKRYAQTGDLEHLHDRWGEDVAAMGGPIPYALSCTWCASVWVAAAVALARTLAPLPWHHAATVLTSSALTGWLSERE